MARKFDAAAAARLGRMYAAPAIVEQRARTRAALGVRPGERGLDVGCGPGFLACELAREVGERGRVMGMDSSADMLVAARERAQRESVGDRVRLARGDATRLPFRTATFDFVTAVQVYLYVADVAAALAEAARVLRRGGRLAVVDTDWDSCVWLTADRVRHQRVMEARMADFVDGHLPPRLPGLLARAGLRVERAEVVPVLERRYDPDGFSVGVVGIMKDTAVRQGVPAAEAEAWAADLRSRTGEGEYFFSLNRFLFLAIKP
jgi:ubiquinone/menaquinone biosynthesis C-methylase UbiE